MRGTVAATLEVKVIVVLGILAGAHPPSSSLGALLEAPVPVVGVAHGEGHFHCRIGIGIQIGIDARLAAFQHIGLD